MSVVPARVARTRLLTASLVGGALLVAACGGGTKATSKPEIGTSIPAARAGTSVVIDTFMFSPKTLRLKVGDTVTWTNDDNILHTVTSGTREYESGDSGHVITTHKDGTFDMQLDGRGATGTYTFAKAGTFHYFCDRHPGMEADIEIA